MEKLNGALEAARVHHALPDHVAETVNFLVFEMFNLRAIFFRYLLGLEFDGNGPPALAGTINMKQRLFFRRHRFNSPITASGGYRPPACRLPGGMIFHAGYSFRCKTYLTG